MPESNVPQATLCSPFIAGMRRHGAVTGSQIAVFTARWYGRPSDLNTALDFLDAVLQSPSVRLLLPTDAYATTFREVCEAAQVRGNLAFDAQITAVCIDNGVREIVTADRDFARFAAIKPPLI